MIQELEDMIESGEISEVEILDFISTLKKLTKKNIIHPQDFELVLQHFGMKRKKSWIRIRKGVKVRL